MKILFCGKPKKKKKKMPPVGLEPTSRKAPVPKTGVSTIPPQGHKIIIL